ncbi:MAG: hypothetical protein IPG64_00875 [Haliea sp.]|nr:hypothetical protein [Haliea sp.]
MKTILALQIATLLSVSITSIAATVDYEHPNLTIVAKDEPLDSVLKSLGKEMRIYIVVPAGLNPIVSCDIQQRPIKQAFKTLLGDMSYSLEWEENTGQLAGLTILAGGGNSAVATVSNNPSRSQNVNQATPAAVARNGGQELRPRLLIKAVTTLQWQTMKPVWRHTKQSTRPGWRLSERHMKRGWSKKEQRRKKE